MREPQGVGYPRVNVSYKKFYCHRANLLPLAPIALKYAYPNYFLHRFFHAGPFYAYTHDTSVRQCAGVRDCYLIVTVSGFRACGCGVGWGY